QASENLRDSMQGLAREPQATRPRAAAMRLRRQRSAPASQTAEALLRQMAAARTRPLLSRPPKVRSPMARHRLGVAPGGMALSRNRSHYKLSTSPPARRAV